MSLQDQVKHLQMVLAVVTRMRKQIQVLVFLLAVPELYAHVRAEGFFFEKAFTVYFFLLVCKYFGC